MRLRHRDRNQSTFTVMQAPPVGFVGRWNGVWQVWVGMDGRERAQGQAAALRAALPDSTFWVRAVVRP